VALVGGDGAGKSTAIEATYDHFSRYFDVARFHMGKPSWSPATFAVRSFLRAGRLLRLYPPESSFDDTLAQQSPVSPGYPWLAREVCRARDRYGTYVKARRHAARGGIVLLDRFPVSQLQLMDGPQGERFVAHLARDGHPKGLFRPHPASRITGSMIQLEQGYYGRMSPPDLLLVLRVEPEVAVRRKTEEDPSQVLVRSTEVWEAEWDGTNATVIDAGRPQAEIAAELRSLIWQLL
jgi:thymidylate kinase